MTVDVRATSHDIIEFLLGYLATTSLSSDEGAAADFMTTALTHQGFSVERDDMGNVIGTRRFGPGPTLLIDTHLDTVGVPDRDSWTADPSGEFRDGRIYGRGAVDMKGPTAAVLFGAMAIKDLEVGTLVVTATIAEELVEGPALIEVCKRVSPDAVIIAEPSNLKLIHAQRGRAEISVTVTGRAAHSAYPSAGINSVEAMVDVISALRGLTIPADPVLGEGAMVVTDVVSSPYPALSVVPVACRATYDRRLVTGETREQVLTGIESLATAAAARSGALVVVSIAEDDFVTYTGKHVVAENFAPAWVTPHDSDLFASAHMGLTRVIPDPTVATYRFCTNGSGAAGVLGIPTLGFGPGAEDEAHTADESLSVTDLHTGVAAFAAMIPAILTRLASSPSTAPNAIDDSEDKE